MENYKPICEVAKMFNVTRAGVRYWIKKHEIPFKFVKSVGAKTRIVLDVKELEKKIGISKED